MPYFIINMIEHGMNIVRYLNSFFFPEGTCSDGIMNHDETGVDCGGATCLACGIPLRD